MLVDAKSLVAVSLILRVVNHFVVNQLAKAGNNNVLDCLGIDGPI